MVAACGGGGGGGSLTPPSSLVFPANPVVATVGAPLPPDTPTSGGGAASSYAVTPTLPAGLTLDPGTGTLSGTPTAATAEAAYTVTAANSAGSTSAQLTLTVSVPSIASFSVSADETLSYPDSQASPPYLVDLPDEHTSFIPLGGAADGYLVFAASRINTVPTGGGAVVLHTADLSIFQFATDLGYGQEVMSAPVPFGQCQPAFAQEFDENYVGPGAVVQDPTLPAGNLIMLYEAENHCPGGVNQTPYYATVGFARSSDNGRTWPAPENGTLGGADRFPVLVPPNPQPSTPSSVALGDAIPSGFVDLRDPAGPYLYVVYVYNSGGLTPAADGRLRVARARLGSAAPAFTKWYQGAFSQPGVGGLDSGVLTVPNCSGGYQVSGQISYNDDLGAYLMTFFSRCGATGAWYYATATSLALQDWSLPQVIANSEGPYATPCSGLASGAAFDGFYPSFMSPGAAAGHTRLTGKAFFLNGCNQGARTFAARDYTIALGAPAAVTRTAIPARSGRFRQVWRVAGGGPSRAAF